MLIHGFISGVAMLRTHIRGRITALITTHDLQVELRAGSPGSFRSVSAPGFRYLGSLLHSAV